jgi:hypothetical protein
MMVSCGLDSSVLGWGPVVGRCEHSNETLGSIKGGIYWLLASQEGLYSVELISQLVAAVGSQPGIVWY